MKVIKFQADWCNPCKSLASCLASLESKYRASEITPIDVDKHPEESLRYNVKALPTMILINDEGEVVDRIVGLPSNERLKSFLGGFID